ncbi:hypothetical protein [Anaerovibrio sp.]|uniref:DUF6978 family protein n=1 Tax=Anaerovibrio sp. TaxID=1872532 RepID=UPI002627D92E|nr:hypothetical protein [Anaerovibrio sp.]MDD6598784.1 hypothetical protein [Anaerovibrio sp.]
MTITQEEADTLRTIEKYLANPQNIKIPKMRETRIYPAYHKCYNKRRDDLDVSAYRGGIDENKVSYRLIYKKSVLLIRIDTNDKTAHINPDKSFIPPMTPHIHVYREGYGDKFAYPLPAEFSSKGADIEKLFIEFLQYSNFININELSLSIIEQEVLIYDK